MSYVESDTEDRSWCAAEAYEEAQPVPASWQPLDLTTHTQGTFSALEPTVMRRTDGVFLLYPGKVHSFQGESESGKSMLAQAETARQLALGKPCLYIDFESDAATIVDRLLKLGAPPEAIRERLHYVNPDIRPEVSAEERIAWETLLRNQYTLAVIDGVTEAFAVFGVKSVDNDEVTAWGRTVPRQLAVRTGAAVVVIDHVTKAIEGRGRFALGAQAKLSILTGASYTVEVLQPIGVGMLGRLSLRVGKDRPGRVRPHSGTWRKSDRTQPAAVAVIDSTDPERIVYALYPGEHEQVEYDAQSDLMERLSKALEDSPKTLSFNSLSGLVSGRRESKKDALARLIEQGYAEATPGAGNTMHHRSISPYRQGETDDLEF